MNIREIIKNELARVVTENSPVPFPEELDDDTPLDEFWLDSIAFASLLTAVEEKVGYIPTEIVEGVFFPTTFGELVSAYTNGHSA